MALGLRAALARLLTASAPSISRDAPYRCMYWVACMPIQLAADVAPNGIRYSIIGPDTRLPGGRSRSSRNVDSHTVRKHSTCLHKPDATASMAATTAPPGPGVSLAPLIHVGWIRRASSTA